MTKAALWLALLIAAIPFTASAQSRDSIGIMLRRLQAEHAYLRIQSISQSVEGRIVFLRADQIGLRDERLAIEEIQAIQQRLTVGPGGFGRGWRIGVLSGLVLSVPMRIFVEVMGEDLALNTYTSLDTCARAGAFSGLTKPSFPRLQP